jgi:voltage-gated potassium channel
MTHDLKKRSYLAGTFLLVITAIGTLGYYFLGHCPHPGLPWPLFDCFYMTMITLTTVGFGEVIDVASVPGARLFTVFLLLAGLGVAAYFVSTLTAFLVEGELTNVFWRKKMEKKIRSLTNHIILCGIGRVGFYIMKELRDNHIEFVVVDADEELIRKQQAKYGEFPAVVGDPTHERYLRQAGVAEAKGVITTLDDDKDNLCVVVTCRQLNDRLHIISSCGKGEFASKLDLLGAEVVMPNAIGGLRIASQMIRPHVVTYLDLMLRDKECVVRIEEVILSEGSNLIGKPLHSIDFDDFGPLLVLAVVKPDSPQPIYNPKRTMTLAAGDTLIVQADLDSIRRFKLHHC